MRASIQLVAGRAQGEDVGSNNDNLALLLKRRSELIDHAAKIFGDRSRGEKRDWVSNW